MRTSGLFLVSLLVASSCCRTTPPEDASSSAASSGASGSPTGARPEPADPARPSFANRTQPEILPFYNCVDWSGCVEVVPATGKLKGATNLRCQCNSAGDCGFVLIEQDGATLYAASGTCTETAPPRFPPPACPSAVPRCPREG